MCFRQSRPPLVLTLALLLAGCAQSSPPPHAMGRVETPLSLREHPRLLLLDRDIPRLREAIARDPHLRATYETLLEQSRRAVGEPMPQWEDSHEGLLTVARRLLNRVMTLGLMYRLSGERSFAGQIRAEMLAVCEFPSWEDGRFLPAAEMTAALGMGYDWLHDFLSESDRATIRRGMIRMSLLPALRAYRAGDAWTTEPTNHNAVGNGGVLLGALAIADDEPGFARELIARSERSIQHSMRLYEPDGAWVEGPIYWLYATRYVSLYLAAMQSATGRPPQLPHGQSFAHTGMFRIHSTGPSRLTFNFGDSAAALHPAPFMYWLAATFDQPIYAAHERWSSPEHPSPLELLWAAQARTAKDSFDRLAARTLPTAARFGGVELAFFRGHWSDPRTTWIGLKGGANPESGTHQHLDLGTFVLDALGQRWAVDLGPDEYRSGYFGRQRWRHYRAATHGHNTLTINNRNQRTGARAPIIAFSDDARFGFAIIDLSDAYAVRGGSVWRGVALLNGRDVVIQDEIRSPQRVNVRWSLHTPAQVQLLGDRAVLRMNGHVLHARILTPAGARFEVTPGDFPAHAERQDVRNLQVDLSRVQSGVRLAVLLSPVDQSHELPPLRPLESWMRSASLTDRPAER